MVTEEKVWQILEQVSDPEIPVLTIADLGIIRAIKKIDNSFQIKITPTYSGCPAMRVIESEIENALANEGITNISIETVLSPAWTTDWLSENGREKLAEYGIAPPVDEPDKSILFAEAPKVSCPNAILQIQKWLAYLVVQLVKLIINAMLVSSPLIISSV